MKRRRILLLALALALALAGGAGARQGGEVATYSAIVDAVAATTAASCTMHRPPCLDP